ncbi:MAG: MarR family winged helix-turn-helix transcriptional regulator [Pseudomonadales bacterium]|jgi:DNA-binding MarR family transcriptional regulator|nr:MarR family winged helix-turn-helix transcriptional regulator [Pseudomonadales bacterium]MDP7451251.1 MarR family winged helix-turn-helix transcriptional regulator [Arenicellales bacterium]MDP6315003.1 MarR family winged helix-turn-helix transcriptional regulator [Pseudomonadales bacterium]MDP7316108.1 MarR family winged helix-turn-helix transcriptional regulator [Pseudomonadales bacterium]MDP7575589.1 MarR family winged helix-turn-helix transcriptional regulator [Pseudomonadales bacterium]|tara:strand:- start:3083 stop:3592 length:510 start_codon:yes stop_codon:yes gene_type:complete
MNELNELNGDQTAATETLIEKLIWQNRRLFQRFRFVSDTLLQDTGINTSQRAVLEFLYKQKPRTVPQIAKEKSVSRQHIQIIVNSLTDSGLIKIVENPSHKRSPLIRITRKGEDLFDSVRRQEVFLFRTIGERFSEEELATAGRVLRSIDEYLASGNWQEPERGGWYGF